jgi:hypothetical protein
MSFHLPTYLLQINAGEMNHEAETGVGAVLEYLVGELGANQGNQGNHGITISCKPPIRVM